MKSRTTNFQVPVYM